jgi:hypothetical protein
VWWLVLPQKLQGALGKLHNFSLAILLAFIVGFDLRIGDSLDHLDYLLRLSNKANKFLVLRLQQLEQSPDGDMLEGRISTSKESFQISMNASIGLSPVLNEDRIITNYDLVLAHVT